MQWITDNITVSYDVEESTFQTNLRDDIRGQMFTGERVGRRRLLVGVWCGACVVELPSLLAFQQSHPHVSVLAVAITDKPS